METTFYQKTLQVRDRIKQRISLRDVLTNHGVNLIDDSSGSKGKALCPFHNEKTPSFHADYQLGVYFCFGCKAGGDIFSFIQNQHGLSSWQETLQYLCSSYGIDSESLSEISPEDQVLERLRQERNGNGSSLKRRREEFEVKVLLLAQKIHRLMRLRNLSSKEVPRLFPLLQAIDVLIDSESYDLVTVDSLLMHVDKKLIQLEAQNVFKEIKPNE